MHQGARLLLQGAGYCRVSMAQIAHADSRDGIKIAFASLGVQPNAFTPLKGDRLTGIGRNEVLLVIVVHGSNDHQDQSRRIGVLTLTCYVPAEQKQKKAAHTLPVI